MLEVSGDFEIHITAHAHHAERLAAFAAEQGVKFLHIVLDRGTFASQPMLTLTGRGTLVDQHATVRHWQAKLHEAGIYPCRCKIEAAPWCTGIPQLDEDAATEPDGRYFEHHIKLLWLATDMYPQGKDLYDAVLLAEHTTVDRALVRDLMRTELGGEADTFSAETVLSWNVDWTNFTDEYPAITGTAEQWINRLAQALDRGWT